jgi:excisionase family DNA binding protein
MPMRTSLSGVRSHPTNSERGRYQMDDFSVKPAKLAYGIAEAHHALGIGRTRLYALIAEGKIEARQCGGRTLIPTHSLRAFVTNLPSAPIRRKDTA